MNKIKLYCNVKDCYNVIAYNINPEDDKNTVNEKISRIMISKAYCKIHIDKIEA